MDMTFFSIDKQREQVNAEWISRPVDSIKNQTTNQSLDLVLISMEQSPIFAFRLKRKLLIGPIFREAYNINQENAKPVVTSTNTRYKWDKGKYIKAEEK
jgi:hypothetical protein